MSNTLILILCLPLLGFGIQIFFGRFLPRKGDWLSTGLIGVSLILSATLFARMIRGMDPHFLFTDSW
ncbi:MAG: hypothetical protein KJ927_11055, partial [Candidatus Eisenbacteria bacterium]|nr:hypothetical protein [Candidatus Eisenbacteria bacterium]